MNLKMTAKLRSLKRCALVLPAMLLACSGNGPKPDGASGEVRPANLQQQALDELIEITRAGQPRRFKAERASDVKQTLQSWVKTAGMTLHFKSKQSLNTTGGIDELDIRAAVMALAQQFPNDQAALWVQFPSSRSMVVSDVLSKDSQTHNCPQVPSGAIVIGQYCLLAEQTWSVNPDDKFLSETLQRWATAAQLQLDWKSELDWPITLKARKSYSGDLLTAISAVTADLATQGVDVRYAITAKALTIHAFARVGTYSPNLTKSPAISHSTSSQKDLKP